MRTTINLASPPFVELRPLFARLRVAMAVLAVLAIGLMFGLHAMNTRARAAEAQMSTLKARTMEFVQERQNNEARMRQPQNAAVLERSRFLNDLFARKSFSWTAVMMDLENILPSGVQVTSIDPQITAEGDVNIRLKVSGDRERAVQLIRNLEGSKRFLDPQLSSETVQTQETAMGGPRAVSMPGGVVFDILSGYNPLPEPVKKKTVADEEQPMSPKVMGHPVSIGSSKPMSGSSKPMSQNRDMGHPIVPLPNMGHPVSGPQGGLR